MGKLGDIALILGLVITGGVIYMFATGKWKLPKFKLPSIDINIPNIPEAVETATKDISYAPEAIVHYIFEHRPLGEHPEQVENVLETLERVTQTTGFGEVTPKEYFATYPKGIPPPTQQFLGLQRLGQVPDLTKEAVNTNLQVHVGRIRR